MVRKKIHDSNRIYRNGRGSYEKVLEGIQVLKDFDIPINLLSVLTKNSISHEGEIYNSFKETGSKNVRINIYTPSGRGLLFKDELYITPKQAGNTLINFYKLWINEKDISFRLHPFEEIVQSMFTGINDACNYSGRCNTNVLSVDSSGDVYFCGRFGGINELRLGNINDDDLENILSNKLNSRRARNTNSVLRECGDCEYIKICNGGCFHESYSFYNSLDHKTPYCESRKMVFDFVKKNLEESVFLEEIA